MTDASSDPRIGSGPHSDRNSQGDRAGWGLRLAILSLAAFAPTVGGDFVQWDDPINFLSNESFLGLGWNQVRWAWTTFLLGVYQPIAWMLLSLQSAVWGLKPSGYHLTSVALHAANAVALFHLTAALLGRARPDWASDQPRALLAASALSAGLFAAHPLRVEAVAWASCQPYLPCALFAMLAVLAYLRADGADGRSRKLWYWASLGFYLAALLSKAVAAGVFVVILILDVYPLRRLGASGSGIGGWFDRRALRVYAEKLPFAALAVMFLAIAAAAKQSEEAFVPIGRFGAIERLTQACYGACFYLEKTLVPVGITAYYPVPPQVEPFSLRFASRIAGVALITLAAWRWRRRWPGLAAAWVAYLAILAPNLGIVRIGDQIAADRYSYLPIMGFHVLLAGGLMALASRFAQSASRLPGTLPKPLIATVFAGIAVLALLSARQSGVWRESYALWSHAYAHGASGNAVVNLGLGLACDERGQVEAAERHYRRAFELRPDQARPLINLGNLLFQQDRYEESVDALRRAVAIEPERSGHRRTFGYVLGELGRLDEAEEQLKAAVRLDPEFADAHLRLAMILERNGDRTAALAHAERAARLKPGDPVLASLHGAMLVRADRFSEAAAALRIAVRLAPADCEARSLLGLALSRSDRVSEGVAIWREIVRKRPDHAITRARLGDALTKIGQTQAAEAQRAAAKCGASSG